MLHVYILSVRHGYGDFRDESVHSTVNSALFRLYGHLRQAVEDGSLDKGAVDVDIKGLQEMDKDALFDEYNRLTLFDRFKITEVKNLTTSEMAVDVITEAIDQRFDQLRLAASADTRVAFPVETLSSEARQEWTDCDPVNADKVINYMDNYISIKINELSIIHNIDVIRKDYIETSDPSLFQVTFNNNADGSSFNIVVSPGGGY